MTWRGAACLTLAVIVSASASAENTVVGKYNGPGGCASSSCHGSIQPKQVTRVAQNEYSIWAGQDKHARAYQVLSNEVSLRIGKILNLKAPPNQNQKCLACHALSVAPEMRAGDLVAILSNGGFGGIYEKLPARLRMLAAEAESVNSANAAGNR